LRKGGNASFEAANKAFLCAKNSKGNKTRKNVPFRSVKTPKRQQIDFDLEGIQQSKIIAEYIN
jgi:hypothetical protein